MTSFSRLEIISRVFFPRLTYQTDRRGDVTTYRPGFREFLFEAVPRIASSGIISHVKFHKIDQIDVLQTFTKLFES